MFCGFSDEQLPQIKAKLRNSIYKTVKNVGITNPETFLRHVYNNFIEFGTNPQYALFYTYNTPSALISLLSDKTISDSIAPHAAKLIDLRDKIEKDPDFLSKILNIATKKDEPVFTERPESPSVQAIVGKKIVRVPLSRRPSNLFTTTGAQTDPEDPKYKVINNILGIIEKSNNDSSETEVVPGGIYLTMSMLSEIPNYEMPAGTEDRIVNVLTDVDGNALYFNSNNEIVDISEPSARIEFFDVRTQDPTKRQTPQEFAKTILRDKPYLTPEQALAEANEIYKRDEETLDLIINHILKNPGARVKSKIIGGSKGLRNFTDKKTYFTEIAEVFNPTTPDTEGKVYIQVPYMDEPIEVQTQPLSDAKINDIATLVTTPVYDETGKQLSPYAIIKLLNLFVFSRKEGINYDDMTDTEITIDGTTYNRFDPATRDILYNRLKGQFQYKEVSVKQYGKLPVFESFDKITSLPTLNPEINNQLDASIKANHVSLFSGDGYTFYDAKMDKALGIKKGMSMLFKLDNTNYVLTKTGDKAMVIKPYTSDGLLFKDGKYTLLVKEIQNLNGKYLAQSDISINDFSLKTVDGRVTLVSNFMPYKDWVKANTFTRLEVKNGRLMALNGYLSFIPLTEEVEAIRTPEAAEEKPIELNVEALQNDLDILKNIKYKTGSQKALNEKLSAEELQEKVNAAEAWAKTKKVTVKKIDPKTGEAKTVTTTFNSLWPVTEACNAVNTSNPNAVSSWVSNAITLYKGSDYTDVYHEAWHGFEESFLTPAQKEALHAEVRKQFPSVDPSEFLAEDFRKFAMSGGKRTIKSPVRKSIFQKIWDFLTALFYGTNIEDAMMDPYSIPMVKEMYDNLYVGNLNQYTFRQSNSALVYNKTIENLSVDEKEELSYEDSEKIVTSINSIIAKLVASYNLLGQTKKFSTVLLSNKESLNVVLKRVKAELQANRNLVLYEIQTKFKDRDKLTIDQVKELQALNYKADLLGWAVKHFGENEESPADSKKGVVPYYIMKTKFLTADEKLSLEEESKDESTTYDKRGNEKSLSDMAAPEINRILSFINDYDASGNVVTDELGFEKLDSLGNNWFDFANLLEDNLGLTDILTRLNEKAKEKTRLGAKVRQFLSYLGNPDSPDQSEQTLLSVVQSAFNITNIQLIRTTLAYNNIDGTFESTVTTSGRNVFQTKRRIDDAFYLSTGHPYIVIDSQGRYLNTNALRSAYPAVSDIEKALAKDAYQTLYNFGVILTDSREVREALSKSKKLRNIAYALGKALGYNKELDRSKDVIRFINDKNAASSLFRDENTAFNEIANIENDFSGKNVSFMVMTAENNMQYVHSQNMSLTMMINPVNAVSNLSQLLAMPHMSHLDKSRNPMLKNHTWMTSLFDKNGNKRGDNKLVIENLSGSRLVDEHDVFLMGIESFSSDNSTRIISDIETFMQRGFTTTLQAGDKSSTYRTGPDKLYVDIDKLSGAVVTDKFYIHPARFLSKINDTDLSWRNNVIDIMLPKVYNEISRIIYMTAINNDPNPSRFTEYNAVIGGERLSEVGADFVDFKDMLSKDTRAAIKKAIKDNNVAQADVDKFFATKGAEIQGLIAEDLLTYFNAKLDLFNTGIGKLMGGISNKTANALFNKYRTQSFGKQITIASDSENKQAIVNAFYVNQLIHNLESVFFFFGDFINYNHLKNEFHKRNTGIQSTGNFMRTDPGFETYINVHKNVIGSYINSPVFTGNRPAAIPTYNGVINTSIVEDVNVRSIYYDTMYAAKLKESLDQGIELEEAERRAERDLKNYEKMNEADGQGYLSFPGLRIVMEGLGIWTSSHQRIYDEIIAGKNVDTKTFNYFFPTLKMQMWGPLATEGFPVFGFHKFSLTPLNPAVIKGTKLEAFHNRMVEQNVHYATYESGSKMVSITSRTVDGKPAYDKFYDTETTQLAAINADYKFTVNPVYPQYFKHQLETGSEIKGRVTRSTQLKKLIPLGLMQNGVPVGYTGTIDEWEALPESKKLKFEKYKLYSNYLKVLNKLVARLEKNLAEEFGFTISYENGKKVYDIKDGNFEKFVTKIRRHLDNKGLPNHIVNYIAATADGNGIQRDLSASLQATEIENAIAALIMKRLVKPKLHGEALIQVASSGFEPTELNRSGFRKPTEEEYEKWKGTTGTNDLPYYYPKSDGTTAAMKIKVALTGSFKKLLKLPSVIEYAEKNNIPKFKALNILIKQEEWLKDHRDMITLLGVRIPVQGFAQMDAMEIYEFLPESAGNIIILPSEIVAKSGGDFDIDKLTILMPSYRMDKGVPKLVEDVDITESIDELTKAKEQYSEALAKVDEDFNEQLKKFDYVFTPEDKAKIKEFRNEFKLVKKQLVARKKNAFSIEEEDMIEREILDKSEEFILNQRQFIKSIVTGSKDYTNILDAWTAARKPIIDSLDEVRTKMDQYSYNGIQNDLIKAMKEILLSKDSYTKLITPNDTYYTQPLAEDETDGLQMFVMGNFNSKSTVFSEPAKKGIVPTKIIEPDVNYHMREVNSVSKETLGIGAKNNVTNVQFNSSGMYLLPYGRSASGKSNYTKRLLMPAYNSIMVDGQPAISLAGIFDANFERNIAEQISQLMNGWVDAAKNPYIYYLQGNKKVSPVILFLVQAGVDLKTAIYFVSQPLIREYTRTKDLLTGPYARTIVPDQFIPRNISQVNQNAFSYLMNKGIYKNVFNRTLASEGRDFVSLLQNLLNTTYASPERQEILDILRDGFIDIQDNENEEIFRKTVNSKYNEYMESLRTPQYWLALGNEGEAMFSMDENWDEMFDNNKLLQTIKETATAKGENEDNWKEKIKADKNEVLNQQMMFLMHYLQIQEMAEAVRKVSANTDFDVINIGSVFELYNRDIKVEKLLASGRLPQKPIQRIISDSPVSAFNAEDALRALVTRLFKLRRSETMENFIKSKMADTTIYDKVDSSYFPTVETYMDNFVNDFMLFIFQNTILNTNTTGKEYKSRALSYNVEIKDAPYLQYGAFVKDNVLYVNRAKLVNEFQSKAYIKSADYKYTVQDETDGTQRELAINLATIPANYITTKEEYVKFVMEREVLRSIYPSIDSLYSEGTYKSIEYKIIVDDLVATGRSQEEALATGYEVFLRNKALENIGNINFMFYSRHALANKLNYIKQNYPELANTYSVLNVIESNWGPGRDEASRIKNIMINKASLDQDEKNKYNNNIIKLSDPTVVKVPNDPAANKFISDVFTMLPIYSFLQAGLNNASRFSLNSIVPTEAIDKILEKPIAFYSKNLNEEMLKLYFDKFNRVNAYTNIEKRDRLRDYRIFGQQAASILRGLDQPTAIVTAEVQTTPIPGKNNVNLFYFDPNKAVETAKAISANINNYYLVNSSVVPTSKARPEGQWDNTLVDPKNWTKLSKANLLGIRTLRGLTQSEQLAELSKKPGAKKPVITTPVKELSLKDTIEELNSTINELAKLRENTRLFEKGDDIEVYFVKSDSESELELKSFSKTKLGYRVVLLSGEKEYTYFVNNEGKGEKIEILTGGVFEITPEIKEKKQELQKKAEELWTSYNTKRDQQVFIQGRVPSYVISPIPEKISLSREIVDNDGNLIRREAEDEVGYKVIIPGHNLKFYLIESTGNIEDLTSGRRIDRTQFKKGLLSIGTNLEKGSENEQKLAELGFDVSKLYKPEKDLSDVSEFTDVTITETPIIEEVSLPAYSYKISSTESLEKAKGLIDEDIDKLVNLNKAGAVVNLNPEGYGTYLKDSPNKYNRELFTHISKRLYESFGYVNPGYYLSGEEKAMVQPPIEVTDQDVADYIIKCLTGL